MSEIAALVKPALLGTKREALPDMPKNGLLGHLIQQVDSPSGAANLLNIAGTLSLHSQTGQQPQRLTQVKRPPELTTDTWPECSPAVSQRLSHLLNGRYEALLGEYLPALVAAQVRIPAILIPELLERGTRLTSLRPYIPPLIGSTGRWLAQQRPKWAYASVTFDNWANLIELWQQENNIGKQAIMRHLRHSQPALGRELLAYAWKSETASTRQGLLRLLLANLTMADEPFLERALDDRDYTIRKKSAEMLTRLPPSRLCQRMIKNVGQVLRWDAAQSSPLTVHFPADLSPAIIRDGVLARTGKNQSQIQSTQLVEMISAVPLTHWTTTWGVTPAQIVGALADSRWPSTLLRALAQATERQGDVNWAKALIDYDPTHINVLKLIPILPPADFVALVNRINNADSPLSKDHPLIKVLRRWTVPWPQAVADIWFRQLAAHIQANPAQKPLDSLVQITVRQSARSAPNHIADAVTTQLLPLVKPNTAWYPLAHECISILTYRRTMLAEISESVEREAG